MQKNYMHHMYYVLLYFLQQHTLVLSVLMLGLLKHVFVPKPNSSLFQYIDGRLTHTPSWQHGPAE